MLDKIVIRGGNITKRPLLPGSLETARRTCGPERTINGPQNGSSGDQTRSSLGHRHPKA